MKTASFLLLLPLVVGCGRTPAGRSAPDVAGHRAVVYSTADSTALRLTPTDTLVFDDAEPTSEGRVYVFVDPGKTFQTLLGIGGALTDAAAETFATLPAARQAQ
ncbi:MAG: glycosyl hydrolase, partial [Gemmatimonadota bacterium]|nr:glycosyl hydrolase [Gemmatimonadota bacterium]